MQAKAHFPEMWAALLGFAHSERLFHAVTAEASLSVEVFERNFKISKYISFWKTITDIKTTKWARGERKPEI